MFKEIVFYVTHHTIRIMETVFKFKMRFNNVNTGKVKILVLGVKQTMHFKMQVVLTQ